MRSGGIFKTKWDILERVGGRPVGEEPRMKKKAREHLKNTKKKKGLLLQGRKDGTSVKKKGGKQREVKKSDRRGKGMGAGGSENNSVAQERGRSWKSGKRERKKRSLTRVGGREAAKVDRKNRTPKRRVGQKKQLLSGKRTEGWRANESKNWEKDNNQFKNTESGDPGKGGGGTQGVQFEGRKSSK